MFFAIAAALSMLSGVAQFGASRAAGDYANTLAGRQAKAMEQQAGQERAASQRGAIEQRRQGRYVRSTAIAQAAASGAGVSDPTVTDIIGDIDQESEYRALTSLYEGEQAGRNLEYQAELTRTSGQAQHNLMDTQGDIALLGGAAGAVGFGAQSDLFSGGGETQTATGAINWNTPRYGGAGSTYKPTIAGRPHHNSLYAKYGYR
jgi:hypothetical protein